MVLTGYVLSCDVPTWKRVWVKGQGVGNLIKDASVKIQMPRGGGLVLRDTKMREAQFTNTCPAIITCRIEKEK